MTTALAAGSLSYNGPQRIYIPNPIILATNTGSGESSATIVAVIPTPDSRTRVKVTVMFVPRGGQAAPDLAAAFTIWIAACDEDRNGGGGGRLVPVTDVEGSSASPTAFPASSGLGGYSREFVTAADYLQVTIALSSITPTPGAWLLGTRIQPDAVSLEWDEWDEIRRAFQPRNNSGMAAL